MSEQNQNRPASEAESAKDALWKSRIEIITPVIMTITAIAIAWSSYQPARWGRVIGYFAQRSPFHFAE